MSETYSIVREAIRGRHQIVATYHGHEREMCPHAIGTKNGRAQALFFQFGGSSGSGLPPDGDWRCLPLDQLANVSSRPGEWHTRPRGDTLTCIDDVDLEVDA